jgi:nickel superoxide dismutase
MIEKIDALGELDSLEKQASFSRCIATKEKHAQKVKTELYILWSDYFKPEHLEKFPDLHNTIWLAAKQAGKVKQTVSAEECQKLVDAVHEVAHLFADSKQ